ncbi:MAG: DMT family transporter [Candidatus Dormibacteraeota bacterium]|nr:DMT family transporter [Candidatus Dormibacteraeota bacterium]MBO0746083.1 DMT family transporter [Candidatus Dormibacteraeota bacterium]
MGRERFERTEADRLTFVLAALAALANATASVLQRKAAGDEPDVKSLRPSMFLDLLRRRVWLGGILAVIAGFVLQAAALSTGSIVAVQPILGFELPLTLLLAWPILHSRLGKIEILAAVAMAVGLAILLVSAAPQPGGHVPSLVGWLVGGFGSAAVIGACFLAGVFSEGARRAALLGIATGCTFGLTAAFMQVATQSFAKGPLAVVLAWETYATIATGILAMYLLQNALQAGRLAAAQPGITIADPVLAGIWGVVLFHDRIRTGPWIAGEILGPLVIVAGMVLLLRSPYLQGEAGRTESSPEEAGEESPEA